MKPNAPLTASSQPDSILRRSDLRAATGLSTSTIYALIRDKKFPAPIRLSVRSVGWSARAVSAWQAERAAAK